MKGASGMNGIEDRVTSLLLSLIHISYGSYAKGLFQQKDVLIAISKNGKCRIH